MTWPRTLPRSSELSRTRLAQELGVAGRPYALENDVETSERRQARRKGALDAGGRIRARGDGAHPSREAWREVARAGDRDRAFEGEAERREAPAAGGRDRTG